MSNLSISRIPILLLFATVLLSTACDPTRRATTPQRPTPTRPGTKPTPPGGNTPIPGKPDPTNPSNPTPTNPVPTPSRTETYRLAVLLPFLTNQFDNITGAVPEKSLLATQFYGGVQVALNEISTQKGNPNLVVDVLDTQAADADFQKILTNPRLQKAQVIIGPIRPSHVSILAEQIKTSHQILISPESPNADLTSQNPGFIQVNPSLRSHCTAIVQHLRSVQRYAPEQVVLVCKEKEAERLPYLQDANTALGGGRFKELKVPDATANFDKIDLKTYLKPGKTTAFVLPSWASQDFVLAFLVRLKAVKGQNNVEVYGMPQWINFEALEPDMLTALNVHISSAAYTDRRAQDVRTFQQKFYELFGTVADEDAFNGYDITLWTARMLRLYGLSFPEKMTAAPALYETLQGGFYFRKVRPTADGGPVSCDYVENIFVHILKFDKYGFVPTE